MNAPFGNHRSDAFVRRAGATWLFLLVTIGSWPTSAVGDRVESSATWQAPAVQDIRGQLEPWLRDRPLDPAQRSAIDAIWAPLVPSNIESTTSLFDRVTMTIGIADPEAQRWIDACRAARVPELLEYSAILSADTDRPAVVRNHLHLLFAKTLVWLHLYDEAASHLEKLDVVDVADPSSLLFHRGVVEYRLRRKEAGLSTLARLLENESALPRRFTNVARLMQADLQGLEEDSLDEVARLMDSIRVRLQYGRAGTRVRDEERQVIEKLEKQIEELEKQQQQMQSQGSAGGQQSAAPAQDSSLPNASGQGDVDRKDHGKDTEWGNLPPAEREAALQQIGEDYPSHFREAAEEYFRALAEEK